MSLDKFIDMAVAAGAEVVRLESADAAVTYLKNYLRDNGVRSILISPELRARPPFRDEFSGAPEKPPAGEIWADVGIVAADFGVAETGTLVHFDRSDEEKNVWTLPEICFCLLDNRLIVQNLEAIAPGLSKHLARTDLPSPQVSLVTGPSRTADIENELTIGVHGPARLIILII
jgi:L-lactate dehydrogenase complex protein LldG